jgi:transcription elongation GreA/GreB family factor
MENLKRQLHDACREFVRSRLENLETALYAAKESGNDETKNTSGDKHETGKAMMQLEQEKIGIQLAEMQKLTKALDTIPVTISEKIKPGNVVLTDQGNFYLSIAAGKINAGNENYFAISPASPLGNLFLKAEKGKEISLQGKTYKVIDTF